MNQVLARLREWLGNGAARAPFEVACRCGALCRGERRTWHQVVRCSQCGRPVFILPRSPLADGAAAPRQPLPRTWPVWLGPVLAGGLSFLLVAAVYFWILQGLVNHTATPPAGELRANLLGRIAAGKSAMERGDFALAHEELAAACQLIQEQADALSRQEASELKQLEKEVGVMASWPGEPLDLIVGRSLKLKEEEWQAVTQRYLGKGMIFDVLVRREASGNYTATFQREPANVTIRLQLRNLALLKYLPLNEPRRLLLGGRLAEIRRDDQGLVHVNLEPESGVLLTDPKVIAACGPAIQPAGIAETVEQQKAWLREAP